MAQNYDIYNKKVDCISISHIKFLYPIKLNYILLDLDIQDLFITRVVT